MTPKDRMTQQPLASHDTVDTTEVVPDLDPFAFTMSAVLDRVARLGDLFSPVLEGGQSLTAALKSVS